MGENSSGLNWDTCKHNYRLDINYTKGISIGPTKGLHKNCINCQHIISSVECRYVATPKARKWPCYFKEHIIVKGDSND